jgi:Domain of unknown function (DUF4232)
VHDFPDPTLGKAIPYGVYDLGANTGMASGITASSQGCIARRERNAVVLGPRSLPAVAGLCLTVVVVMVVDDAGTGRSQSAGGAVPGPRAWDHIPPCGSDDLAVSVRWERVGVGLVGQIIVENVSGRTCQLSEKPWVVPLGADGKQLPVEALSTMEARDQPVILAPGERAAAPIEWAGWCGDPASGVARVNWFSGSAVVEVEGPRQPDCPDPGQPTNLSSSWFDALD